MVFKGIPACLFDTNGRPENAFPYRGNAGQPILPHAGKLARIDSAGQTDSHRAAAKLFAVVYIPALSGAAPRPGFAMFRFSECFSRRNLKGTRKSTPAGDVA
jgi:hypothetical protein